MVLWHPDSDIGYCKENKLFDICKSYHVPPESNPVDTVLGQSHANVAPRSVCQTNATCHWRHRQWQEQTTGGACDSWHCPAVRLLRQLQPLNTAAFSLRNCFKNQHSSIGLKINSFHVQFSPTAPSREGRSCTCKQYNLVSEVNRHTMWCAGPMPIMQLQLVSGWGSRNRRSSPSYKPSTIKGLNLNFFTVSAQFILPIGNIMT